jgi:hypothetical protein
MKLSCCVVALAVLAATASAEDVTIVSKATQGDKVGTTTSYYTAEKLRISTLESDGIVDYASGSITTIDHKKKEYSVMTKEEMEAMAAQMDAKMKEMEAQMASMPPAIREKMAGMMGGIAGEIKVQKGTGGRTIAGYACQNWIVTMGESMKQESCVTTDLELPAAAFDAQKAFFGGASNSGAMGKFVKAMHEKFKEMKGIALASTSTMKMMGKTHSNTTEATEIKKGAIPASAFEIPAGYKKVESPGAKMLKKK